MATKFEIQWDQIFDLAVEDDDGNVRFSLSGRDGTEVTIRCKQNELRTFLNVMGPLYQEARDRFHAKRMN